MSFSMQYSNAYRACCLMFFQNNLIISTIQSKDVLPYIYMYYTYNRNLRVVCCTFPWFFVPYWGLRRLLPKMVKSVQILDFPMKVECPRYVRIYHKRPLPLKRFLANGLVTPFLLQKNSWLCINTWGISRDQMKA